MRAPNRVNRNIFMWQTRCDKFRLNRHCEERSDEAIQTAECEAGLLRFARNDGLGIAKLIILEGGLTEGLQLNTNAASQVMQYICRVALMAKAKIQIDDRGSKS
jgi:hypothetical protein